MKLNKDSQATLTALAKFLKELGNSGVEAYNKDAKGLSKQLTALRADIKALEAASAEFAEKSGVEVSGETPVVPMTPPEAPPVVVADEAQPQFDLAGQPVLVGNINTQGTVQFSGLTAAENKGVVLAPEHVDATGAKGYELAFYVSPVQVAGDSQFIGRRPTAEGNFTMPLFKQV